MVLALAETEDKQEQCREKYHEYGIYDTLSETLRQSAVQAYQEQSVYDNGYAHVRSTRAFFRSQIISSCHKHRRYDERSVERSHLAEQYGRHLTFCKERYDRSPFLQAHFPEDEEVCDGLQDQREDPVFRVHHQIV